MNEYTSTYGRGEQDMAGPMTSELAGGELREARTRWLSDRLEPDVDRWRRSQFNLMLEELAQKALDESVRLGESVAQMRDRIEDAYDLLCNVRSALSPTDWYALKDADEEEKKAEDARRQIVWYRKDPQRAMAEGYDSAHLVKYDPAELHEHVATYLERPWLGRTMLEWALVDAMMYREISQYADALKRDFLPGKRDIIGRSEAYEAARGELAKMSKAILKQQLEKAAWKLGLLVVGPPALALYLLMEASYQELGSGLGVAWFFLFAAWVAYRVCRFLYHKVTKREDPREKAWRLWNGMAGVYKLTEGPVINPVHLRDALLRTRDQGAVWDGPLYAMVDRIVARDPSAWVISERYAYRSA